MKKQVGSSPQVAQQDSPLYLRLASKGLTGLLTLLFFWLLGFVLRDIDRISGPDYAEIEGRHVKAETVDLISRLQEETSDLRERIQRQGSIQATLQRSMENARQTMSQLLENQRLSLEKEEPRSELEEEAFRKSQSDFLEAQGKFEAANQEVVQLEDSLYVRTKELKVANQALEAQRVPATEEYGKSVSRHRFWVAFLKILFIVPLSVAVVWGYWRWRGKGYDWVLVAGMIAVSLRLIGVMFDHFPREFFKYLAILAGIGLTVFFMRWVLQQMVKPREETLVKRFREAYRKRLCPVCSFVIGRDPLASRDGGRPRKETGRLFGDPMSKMGGGRDLSPYSCPSCGSKLFEVCKLCGKMRHSFLPFCQGCGGEKVEGEVSLIGRRPEDEEDSED